MGFILEIPRIKSKKALGDRFFSMAAPTIWNKLPEDIRNESNFNSFKSLLNSPCFLYRV